MRQSRNKSLAKKKADKYFSEYIRIRDADSSGICTCCTCGKKAHWKEMDAGHFISRNHIATRYDEYNAHAQCPRCNRFESGRQYEHGKFIEEQHGKQTLERILHGSEGSEKQTQEFFEQQAERFSEDAAALRSRKGL